MRIPVAAMLLLCATAAVAQDKGSGSDLFDAALQEVTWHVHGLGGNLPDRNDMRRYAISSATVTGAERAFSRAASRLYDAATADEIVASYREVNRASMRIDAASVNGARVLSLDEFATGTATYDWERLNQKYPDIKAIFRISQPATAGYYALVYVEIITPAGPEWVNFLELRRKADGSSWEFARGIVGLPSPEASPVAAGRERQTLAPPD
jgi:hypothetical protein